MYDKYVKLLHLWFEEASKEDESRNYKKTSDIKPLLMRSTNDTNATWKMIG